MKGWSRSNSVKTEDYPKVVLEKPHDSFDWL